MKTILFILLMPLLVCAQDITQLGDVSATCDTVYYPPPIKPKQFQVVFTITYDKITLDQASVIEKYVREKFTGANKIDIELSDVGTVKNSDTWHHWNTFPNVESINDGGWYLWQFDDSLKWVKP